MRQVPIDIDSLAEAFNVNEQSGEETFLNLGTGETFHRFAMDNDEFAPEDLDSDRWILVPALGTREQYRLMERFAEGVEDGDERTELLEALAGKGAFSRFRSAVAVRRELQQAWYDFRENELERHAREWLAELEIEAPPSRRRSMPPGPPPVPKEPPLEVGLVELLLFGDRHADPSAVQTLTTARSRRSAPSTSARAPGRTTRCRAPASPAPAQRAEWTSAGPLRRAE